MTVQGIVWNMAALFTANSVWYRVNPIPSFIKHRSDKVRSYWYAFGWCMYAISIRHATYL